VVSETRDDLSAILRFHTYTDVISVPLRSVNQTRLIVQHHSFDNISIWTHVNRKCQMYSIKPKVLNVKPNHM
jgi:capsule polysaccharide modification protein KpsS